MHEGPAYLLVSFALVPVSLRWHPHTPRLQRLRAHAEEGSWPYRDFLALLVRAEVAHRKQTRLQRFTRRARFPYLKTIDEFDFTLQSTLRASLISSYLGPDFVTEGRSLILHGKTARGKTHLAVTIAYRAIQNGFEALFTTAAQLIETLAAATQKGRLHALAVSDLRKDQNLRYRWVRISGTHWP